MLFLPGSDRSSLRLCKSRTEQRPDDAGSLLPGAETKIGGTNLKPTDPPPQQGTDTGTHLRAPDLCF